MEEKNKVKTEQQRMECFFNEYKKLCERHRYIINVNPAFKSRDDGTWSIVLQTSVGKLSVKKS